MQPPCPSHSNTIQHVNSHLTHNLHSTRTCMCTRTRAHVHTRAHTHTHECARTHTPRALTHAHAMRTGAHACARHPHTPCAYAWLRTLMHAHALHRISLQAVDTHALHHAGAPSCPSLSHTCITLHLSCCMPIPTLSMPHAGLSPTPNPSGGVAYALCPTPLPLHPASHRYTPIPQAYSHPTFTAQLPSGFHPTDSSLLHMPLSQHTGQEARGAAGQASGALQEPQLSWKEGPVTQAAG